MKRKKKHNHEEHISEGWLIPYADLLTLLLALFIVLFASSSIDQVKLMKMSQTFNQIFSGGISVMDSANFSNSNIDRTEHSEVTSSPRAFELAQLDELKERINRYIEENELGKELSTTITEEGLTVTINDKALFDSASATLDPTARRIAKEIGTILTKAGSRQIVVTGHTDNVPINSDTFPSNWELSSARATSFMRALLENDKLDPKQFSLRSYGEYRPIATNSTADGRAKNRRVEVLIRPLVNLNDGAPQLIETIPSN